MSKKRKRKGRGPRPVPRETVAPQGVLHRLCLDALQRGSGIALACDRCWAETFDIVGVRNG